MEEEKAIAAPLKLFKEVRHAHFIILSLTHTHTAVQTCERVLCVCASQHQSFPQSRNAFKVGMKLEGLDPCHPSLFCVLSVAEVRV